MVQQQGQTFGRQKNNEKMRTFVRDDENTLLMAPNDYTGNKFIGNGWNFLATLN